MKKSKTRLEQHCRHGTQLVPPLAAIPNLKLASWRNDRLPELLWAILIAGTFPQARALRCFREALVWVRENRDEEFVYDLRHSAQGRWSANILTDFLRKLLKDAQVRRALRPLLLFQGLPAAEVWRREIGENPVPEDWSSLARCVARTLSHQSQESTDVRWLRVMAYLLCGRLHLSSEERIDEYRLYPDVDLSKVRPAIRATEGALDALGKEKFESQWSGNFWEQCLRETSCFSLPFESASSIEVGTTVNRVRQVYSELVHHAKAVTTTSAVDPRHDTVFGVGLFSLAIFEEILRVGLSQSVLGRLALRTLADCVITLAYLVYRDDPRLWESYRVFGAGQAKLAYIKLEDAAAVVSSIDVDVLKAVANEDLWDEYLSIELGHWEKSNSRRMSEEAGVKEVYDRYYGWTSAFLHGHWFAIRDTVFDTCGNPLHRLHRTPREEPRRHPDVILDAVDCVDSVLELVAKAYAPFIPRLRM